MLIIACGNSTRGDDGAGLLVAERLQKLGIKVTIPGGDALALIELWSGIDNVILIDAATTGAPVGTVHNWDADRLPSGDGPLASTHGVGIAQAIELARNLHRLPRELRICAIEGSRFRLGEDMSPQVRKAVEEVVCQVAAATTENPLCAGASSFSQLDRRLSDPPSGANLE